eukprot:2345845-Pyramimonas_sp.AAC.1
MKPGGSAPGMMPVPGIPVPGSVPGQPAYYNPQPAPAQYAGVTYTEQPPSYHALQPHQPAPPSAAEKLLSKAGDTDGWDRAPSELVDITSALSRIRGTAMGNACSAAATRAGNFMSHASAAGIENTLNTITGKCNYGA